MTYNFIRHMSYNFVQLKITGLLVPKMSVFSFEMLFIQTAQKAMVKLIHFCVVAAASWLLDNFYCHSQK